MEEAPRVDIKRLKRGEGLNLLPPITKVVAGRNGTPNPGNSRGWDRAGIFQTQLGIYPGRY